MSSAGCGRSSVARLLVLSGDLLFGSRLHGTLSAAGHMVELTGDEAALRARLGDRAPAAPGALLVDLTDPGLDGAGALRSLRRDGALGKARALAFYSHVDTEVRERAERAGFDLVVPRSRMAREAAALVEGLLAGDG
jgi:CheY-like chemotaxis protein